MDVVSVKSSQHAQKEKTRTVHFATLSAEMATTVSDQCAGRIVRMHSGMMELSATSQVHTEEVLAQFTSVTTAKSGAFFGTPNAETASTTLHAAFVRQIAHQV